jgi:hypothetical protein
MVNDNFKGGKCCCCGFRMAVLILSTIAFLGSIVQIVLYSTDRFGNTFNDIKDPDERKEAEDLFLTYRPVDITIYSITLALSIVGFLGAFKYQNIMIGVPVLWSIIGFILNCIFLPLAVGKVKDYIDNDSIDWEGTDTKGIKSAINVIMILTLILNGLFIICWNYPSVMLIRENRAKNTAEENA